MRSSANLASLVTILPAKGTVTVALPVEARKAGAAAVMPSNMKGQDRSRPADSYKLEHT